MADVIPKLKMYVFISIIQLLINLVALIFSSGISAISSITTTITAFIPFIGLLNLAFLGIPTEAFVIIGLITGLFSVIQTFIILVVIGGFMSNILWHPDL